MSDTEIENFLRKYMMKTILQDIDDNQPPEFSSEIRPVTVMFINMMYVSAYTPTELCGFVQEATVIISKKLSPHGHINKISFFNKDCTFLCVFSLPGYKRKDESALKAADLMGDKVNLAARLMMYYPGIVSCDWETRYYSGLPSCCFIEEIEKDLKGVSDLGKIYHSEPRSHLT
ncbi:adenylate cyclase type 10-like [Pangasianodon hypophthalmus]|uniref:adenylate cyclase type 10-like n=1 Tax=Pangasianodon hypophthalmus TaxID=310915 RepID=UPI0023079EDC|nr:adenylate cyclase type 10-like [Pangasianodon hypophthalmus]